MVQVNLSGWGVTNSGVSVVAASDPGGGGYESELSGCQPAGAAGACTATVVMPASPIPITYYFVAQEDGLIVTSTTTFTVTPPSMMINPTCGSAGSVTITGNNFTSNDTVNLNYSYDNGSEFPSLGTASTDANGNFTQTVTLPNISGLVTAAAESVVIDFVTVGGPSLQEQYTYPSCGVIGTVSQITGTVTADGVVLSNGNGVVQDATITTGPNSTVLITFNDNTSVTLPPNSSISLDQYVYNPSGNTGGFFWRSLGGAFQYISGLIGHTNTNENIETPVGTIGIRGTQFILWPGSVPNSIEIDLLTGIVAVTPNQAGTTQFTAPITIVMSASGTTTSTLTQAQYNTIYNNLFPTTTDTTPPAVTVTFPAAPAGQSGFFNAGEVPVQGTVSAKDPSNVTAISCTDSLSGLTQGTLTGGGTAAATATLSVTGNGAHSITCSATDGVGNTGAAPGSTNTASISIDITPPTITGSPLPAADSYGWNNTSVVVSFTCLDAISGIASCTGPTTFSTQGANQSVTGTAVDKAGNSAQQTVNGINIDETAPTVTYTGNAGTYTTSQTVAITCTASDALSGIASTTCANINGTASSFGVGTHTYSATATDKAGNMGSATTSFTVTAPVTFQALIQLVDSDESKPAIRAVMDVTLLGADAAFALKDKKTGDQLLNDFMTEVAAQSGKTLTSTQAAQLTGDAQSLME